MAHNRKRPRARTWTLETLDRDQEYVLRFDHEAFRWEVLDASGSPVVTRVAINRRSAWPGDRTAAERTPAPGVGAPAPDPGAGSTAPGRHRATA